MQFLSLPLELIQKVLSHAIRVRGTKRALRLRLVNSEYLSHVHTSTTRLMDYKEYFSSQIVETLIVYRLLEPDFDPKPDYEGKIKHPPFAASYLQRRVLNDAGTGISGFVRIRNIAERLCQETDDGRGIHDYIEQLCRLVLEQTRYRIFDLCRSCENLDTSDFDVQVYIAATYTRTMPVVHQWIQDGKKPNDSSLLFGPSCYVSADNAIYEVLTSMMIQRYKDLAHCSRLHALDVAAHAGNVDVARFAFDFEVNGFCWEFTRDKRNHPHYIRRNESRLAEMATPSREVFEFLMEKRRLHCINREFGPVQYTCFLRGCAVEGWTEMAEHYLSLGASVEGAGEKFLGGKDRRPLVLACRHGHKDTIRMLLEHQADTAVPALELAIGWGDLATVRLLLQHKAEFGDALSLAAAKGHMDVVQELLDHGADINIGSRPLLAYAIEHEHVALFRLLVERGCDPRVEEAATEFVGTAKEHGLESMLQLLREYGVNSDDTAMSAPLPHEVI